MAGMEGVEGVQAGGSWPSGLDTERRSDLRVIFEDSQMRKQNETLAVRFYGPRIYNEHQTMLKWMPGVLMRTTITLDDELVRTAQEFTGVTEKTVLIREALKSLIEREAARRLAALGGTMPELENIPRRRQD